MRSKKDVTKVSKEKGKENIGEVLNEERKLNFTEVSKEDENDVFQFDYDPCWDKVLPCKILEDTCQCSCAPGLSLDHNDYICKPGNPCEPNPCGPDCTLERYGDECQCRWCDTDDSDDDEYNGYDEPTTPKKDPTMINFPRSNFPKSSNSSATKFSSRLLQLWQTFCE